MSRLIFTKYPSLALMGLISLSINYAYAQTPCDSKEFNYLHCVYSNDKENNAMGNYVRLSIMLPNGKEFFEPKPSCMAYGTDEFMIFNEDVISNLNKYYFLGQNTLNMQVCADKNCEQSQRVGQDIFVISATQDKNAYSITPATYGFSFAGIYPAIDCNQANKENGLLKSKNKLSPI